MGFISQRLVQSAAPSDVRAVVNHPALVSIGMSPAEADRWLEKTAALEKNCGCTTGTWFVGAALFLYPLLWHAVLQYRFHTSWRTLLVWAVVIFVAGAVGKVVGLLTARIQLQFRLRGVSSRLSRASPG